MSPKKLFSPDKIEKKQLSVLKEQSLEEQTKTEPEIEIVDTENQ